MSVYQAAREDMEVLRVQVDASAAVVGGRIPVIVAELGIHGLSAPAATVAGSLERGTEMLLRWGSSLRGRITTLDRMAGVPATTHGYPPSPTTGPDPDRDTGRRLGAGAVDSLLRGDHPSLLATLHDVQGTSPVVAGGFLETLGPDTVGLFPTLVFEQGVAAGELASFLDPMAEILHAGMGEAWFDLSDVYAGQAGSEVAPTAYLDFAPAPEGDLTSAAVPYLAAFAAEAIQLRMPPYTRPDGSTAADDPRLPVVENVLRWDPEASARFVAAFDQAGRLGALIDPETAWGDGGIAIARLIVRLGSGGEPAVTVAPSLLREIAGSPTVPAPVAATAPVLVGVLLRTMLWSRAL